MKNVLYKAGLLTFAGALFMTQPQVASADAAEGDVIVTLGEDLTPKQKEDLLKEMNVDDKALMVTVSNSEEHKYLDDYMPKAQIGTRSISSSKITISEAGAGLHVQSSNINYVSDEMYLNALTTAGVKDAEIYITAPFSVSGTAALTGITKAYEVSTGEEIPEEQKQIANEEMVKTAELADQNGVGDDKAAAFMATVKEKIGEAKPETKEEVQAVIEDAANTAGITLTETQIEGYTDFFTRMKEMNIDWNVAKEQAAAMKEKFDNFIQSDEAKGMFEKIGDWFQTVIDTISGWFGK